jgi:hypothetical protein
MLKFLYCSRASSSRQCPQDIAGHISSRNSRIPFPTLCRLEVELMRFVLAADGALYRAVAPRL